MTDLFKYISLSPLIFCTIIISGLSTTVLQAQFVTIQIEIEPEVKAEVKQNLNFRRIVQLSGVNRVELGDPQMGIFSITGLYNMPVNLSFNIPEALYSESAEAGEEMPLDISVAYNNSGTDDYRTATLIESQNINLVMGADIPGQLSEESWHTLYIYMFGEIYAGDISLGEYSNEIILEVNHL